MAPRRIQLFLRGPDQWFLSLRVILLGAGILGGLLPALQRGAGDGRGWLWLLLLLAYSVFCAGVYLFLYRRYPRVRSTYHASLYGDLLFVTLGTASSGGWGSEGYLGYLLVGGTAAGYFGYRIFPALPASATLLYLAAVALGDHAGVSTVGLLLRSLALWLIPLSVAVLYEWRQEELGDLRARRDRDRATGEALEARVFTIKEEMHFRVEEARLEAMRCLAAEIGRAFDAGGDERLREQLLIIGGEEVRGEEELDFALLVKECLLRREADLLRARIVVKKRLTSQPLLVRGDRALMERFLSMVVSLALRDLPRGGKVIMEVARERGGIPKGDGGGAHPLPEGASRRVLSFSCVLDGAAIVQEGMQYFAPRGGDLRTLELYAIARRHRGVALAETRPNALFVLFHLPLAPEPAERIPSSPSVDKKGSCSAPRSDGS